MPNDLYQCAQVQLGTRPYSPATTVDNAAPSSPISSLNPGLILPTNSGQSLLSFLSDVLTVSSAGTPTPEAAQAQVSSTPNANGAISHPASISYAMGAISPLTSDSFSYANGATQPSFSTSYAMGAIPPSSDSYENGVVSPSNTNTRTYFSTSIHQSRTLITPSPPPPPTGTQSTSTIISTITTLGATTLTSCPASLTPCPLPYFLVSSYTSSYVSTLYSCSGGCLPPFQPTEKPILASVAPAPDQATTPSLGGQVTSTTLSTTVLVKTSTISNCAPMMTDCPASLPATTTYLETQTKTVLTCDWGCTGAAPVGAKDVCVRRWKKVEL